MHECEFTEEHEHDESGGGKCVIDLHDYYVGLHHVCPPTLLVSGVSQSV